LLLVLIYIHYNRPFKPHRIPDFIDYLYKVNPDDTKELALTIEGKKKKLKWENFEKLGINLGLNEKQIKSIAKQFQKNKPVAFQLINNSFLSEEYKEKYKTLLEERYRSLFLRE
jgi:serine/threonine-protein kinase HipA